MARKSPDCFRKPSWYAIGIDTSMSSIAGTSIGYDSTLDKLLGPFYASVRWDSGQDYLVRLEDAARAERLVHELLKGFYVAEPEKVYIAIEEPWYFGAVRAATAGKGKSGWLKQQAEVAGCVKGAILRAGFKNLHEVNNKSWKKIVNYDVKNNEIYKHESGKWLVKQWAIEQLGLPDLPDLVEGAHGKTPRPESGRGANAKAVQPDDVYDAAGVMYWMLEEMGER